MVRGITSLKRHKQRLEKGRKEAWESRKSTQDKGRPSSKVSTCGHGAFKEREHTAGAEQCWGGVMSRKGRVGQVTSALKADREPEAEL